MNIFVSFTAPSGHLVVARTPHGASFTASYTDDGTVRDITTQIADLLLAGALTELSDPGATVDDPVTFASLSYDAPTGAGLDATFTLVNIRTGQGMDIPAENVLPLVGIGMRRLVEDAIAEQTDDDHDQPEGASDAV